MASATDTAQLLELQRIRALLEELVRIQGGRVPEVGLKNLFGRR